jgi:hypothetical protein
MGQSVSYDLTEVQYAPQDGTRSVPNNPISQTAELFLDEEARLENLKLTDPAAYEEALVNEE